MLKDYEVLQFLLNDGRDYMHKVWKGETCKQSMARRLQVFMLRAGAGYASMHHIKQTIVMLYE